MKTSASLHLRSLLASLGLLLSVLPPARAEEPAARTSPDEPLVIAKGQFTRDGKTMPATLGNVLAVVGRRYPDSRITMVGVDKVLINDLTLQWARFQGVAPDGKPSDKINPPLQGVLRALSEASGRKFEPVPSSDNDFLLRVPEHLRVSAEVYTEVFNLSPFFPHLAKKRELERLLRETEIEKGMIDKQRPDYPGQMLQIERRIGALAEQLAVNAKVTVDVTKLTAQIREVVEETLVQQSSGSVEYPKFQFHAGTNLLIVTGSDRAVNITQKVIAALEKNP